MSSCSNERRAAALKPTFWATRVLGKAIAIFLQCCKPKNVQTQLLQCSFSTTWRSHQYLHAKAEEPPNPPNVVASISDLRKTQNANAFTIHPCIHFTTPAKTIITAALHTSPILSTTYQIKHLPGVPVNVPTYLLFSSAPKRSCAMQSIVYLFVGIPCSLH